MTRVLKKAQSTAEYAILISLVIAAAMGIQNEVRRALQARIHNEVMQLSQGQQYEPAQGLKTTTKQQSHKNTTENYSQGNQNEDWMTINENASAEYTAHEVK